MLLKGKKAVVTGASSGIGQAIAEVFLENGAQVVGLNLREGPIQNESYRFIPCDVSRTEDCRRVFETITDAWDRIDILVNCAGITRDAMTWKMTEDQWDQVIAVDLKGVWNLTRLIGPAMKRQGEGSIVNISSAIGVFGNLGQVNYAAAKAGIFGMTKTWAKEFALGGGAVRVNAVAPGWTMTDMMRTVPEHVLEKFKGQTALGRLAQPEDIANAVLFLASDLSGYVTGEILNVNGGLSM